MDLLLERGALAGVGHVRLQEVVRRAGVTTGAAYRLWADQVDFQRDLAVAVARWRTDDPAANTWRAVGDLIEAGASLDEVIRVGAAAHIDSLVDEGPGPARLFRVALALRASSQGTSELRAASAERHAASVAEFGGLYETLMAAYGLRPAAPFSVEDFTVAMAALGEGFALHSIEGLEHRRLDLTDTPGLPDGEWTLFGCCVRALVDQFFEPDPTAPRR